MFLAPCTLPLVPGYLAFISGVSLDTLKTNPRAARRAISRNACAFVIGFSVVFTIFGMLAGLLGAYATAWRDELSTLGGVCIVLFGCLMLGALSMSYFEKEMRLPLPAGVQPGHPVSSGLIGAIFALGWTPCVGPILASILLLATTSTTILTGGFLLAVFSLGLAIPFILTALAYSYAEGFIARFAWLSSSISVLGGVCLVCLGLLMIISDLSVTIVYGERIMHWLGLNFDWVYDWL